MRDDINKLPIPKAAKSYDRRHGLAAMKRQPQSYINMVAAVTDQEDKKHGFKNDDEGQTVKHAFKEDAELIVAHIIEAEDEEEFKDVYGSEKRTYYVRQLADNGVAVVYDIEVPPMGDLPLVNKITLLYTEYAPDEMQDAVIKRMQALIKSRKYPPGSVFVTPWGRYRIGQ